MRKNERLDPPDKSSAVHGPHKSLTVSRTLEKDRTASQEQFRGTEQRAWLQNR